MEDLIPAPVELEQQADGVRLTLRAGLDVSSIRELHGVARTALSGSGPVRVHCDDADYLDTAVVQVLLALKRELVRLGRSLHLQGLSEKAAAFWRMAGLTRELLEDSHPCAAR